jgi:Protein of unknown function (DUF2442)
MSWSRLVRFEFAGDYRLFFDFDAEVNGTIDIAEKFHDPRFEQLCDVDHFLSVRLTYAGLCWPNGVVLGWREIYFQLRSREFAIGRDFWMSGSRWRCTDIGTRTIIAIKLEYEDESWYTGPSYAVAEHVIDEDSLPACSTRPVDD